jgi:hypothetical protein
MVTSRPSYRSERSRTDDADPFSADHPEPAMLVAYDTGALAEAERDLVADHLAVCSSCVELVRDHRGFAALALGEPGFAFDAERQAVEWSAVQDRLRDKAGAADNQPLLAEVVPLASRQEDEETEPVTQRTYPAVRALRYAVAAALVGVAVALWFLSLERRLALASDPQVNIAYAILQPAKTVRSGASIPVVSLPPGSDLTLILGADWLALDARYGARLLDDAGAELWRADGLAQRGDGTFSFRLPRRFHATGRYRLFIETPREASPRSIYRFAIGGESG